MIDTSPGSDFSWLTTVPASDGNFQGRLRAADNDALNAARKHLATKTKTKTAVAAIDRELRRRAKGAIHNEHE